jgi:hypothetical protein
MMKMEHKPCYFFAVILVVLSPYLSSLVFFFLLVHDVLTASFVVATAFAIILLDKTLNTYKVFTSRSNATKRLRSST